MGNGTLRDTGRELVALDHAVFAAVHATPSPTIDHALALVSGAADHSRIWMAIAGGLALAGERPRRAALVGLAALGVTSALVNTALKPAVRRVRPSVEQSVRTRLVRMPRSPSYPSGHAASAFAFSTAVGGALPRADTALSLVAAVVAYSRVHTGVHYPADVMAGALVGAGVGSLACHLAARTGFLDRRRARPGRVPSRSERVSLLRGGGVRLLAG